MELHTSPLGGHSGFLKTYHRVKKDFFWDGLKLDIQNFVAECLVCQQNKVETIKTLGLLQPFIHSKPMLVGGFNGFYHRFTQV